MRNTMLALLAVAAAGALSLVASGPASARDYPYCVRGGGYGYPGGIAITETRRTGQARLTRFRLRLY